MRGVNVSLEEAIAENRQYNAERKRMHDIWLKDLDREKFIKSNHENSIKKIQEMIDKFYLNYAEASGISLKEAKKRADDMDIRDYQDKAKKAVEEAERLRRKLGRGLTYSDFSPDLNYWLKIYNLKMKVSRLELMKAKISLELHEMYSKDYEYMVEGLKDEVIDEYRNQAGILGYSAEVTEAQIEKIIMMDFHGKNFSERIWGRNGYFKESQKEIFNSLSSIYTTMEGYQKERVRLQEKFQAEEWEVMRLLKTEVQRVNSRARQEVYNEQGFTHYHYVAEPGACPICKELDGKIFKVEDRELGVNASPMHPNCRCRDYGEIELFLNGRSTITGKRKRK